MKFTKEEIEFIKISKETIKSFLKKRLEDVFDGILYEKENQKVEVLRLWAKEIRELIIAVDNLTDNKPKKTEGKKNNTGI